MIVKYIKQQFKSEKYFFIMTPAIAWQVLFFILPLFVIGALSFVVYESDYISGVTFSYITDVLTFHHFSVIFRSFCLASFTAFSTLIFGYPLAYFLVFRANKYQNLFLLLMTIPFLVNLLVQIYAWFFLLEKNGFINDVLYNLGLIAHKINIIDSTIGLYLVMFHLYLPFMILPIYASVEKIDKRLVEASSDLGASFVTTLRRVIFPLSVSGIKSGFFLVFVIAFGEYVIPDLLGGSKSFFVGTLISQYFFIGIDWSHGAAFTFVSSICLFFFVLVYYFFFSLFTPKSVRRR